MNVHPQLFHGQNPLSLELLVGHAGLGSEGASQVPIGQISPDKGVNCGDTTAAFTVSPESRASLCRADLPRD